MAAKALLDREPDPTDAQIIDALEGNLCRCTGYVKIIDAVRLAAGRIRAPAGPNPLPAWEGSLTPAPHGRRPEVIGGSMLRTDSIPKVTGAARYVEDMVMPGTLHGARAALAAPSCPADLAEHRAGDASCRASWPC